MKKRIISLLFVLCMVFVLAGCSGGKEDNAVASGETAGQSEHITEKIRDIKLPIKQIGRRYRDCFRRGLLRKTRQ